MSQLLLAQPTIIVKDNRTKEPVPYVHISYKNARTQEIKSTVTSENGIGINIATEKSTITITYVGYRTIVDSIMPNQSKTYFLEEDIFLMDQVVVTATRTKKSLKNTPVITQIITAKQIASRGFENVQNVLEADMPSIEFQRLGFGTGMNMQGIDARNILILIDGERLAGESRGNIDYSRLNTNDIEQIEIVKGASSALYGSQAMGAVINIITKSSKKKFYANASTRYTSNNQVNYSNLDKNDEFYQFKNNLDLPNLVVNASLGFNHKKLGGKTTFTAKTNDAYQLYDRTSFTKEYVNIDTVIHQILNEIPVGIQGLKDYSIGQKISYDFSKKLYAEVNGNYYTHHQYDFTRDKRHDVNDALTSSAKLRYTGDNGMSIISTFSADTYKRYDYFEKLNTREIVFSHSLINPRVVATFNVNSKNLLTSGAEFIYESMVGDMFIPDQLSEQEQNSLQFFLQNDMRLGPRTNVIAGIRGEYHSDYGFNATPKLSFMQKLDWLTFRVNYAAGYRSPSLKELYFNWDHLGLFQIKGDENLIPETNNYFSGSVEYTGSRINTSVSFYKNYFKNKIIGQWGNNQSVFQYTNADNTELTGVDFLLNIKLTNSFAFKTAFSFVDEKVEESSVRLSSISPITANAQLEYTLSKKKYELVTTILGKYIGAKDFRVLDELDFRGETVEGYYEYHLEGYWMWRLTVSQNFNNYINVVVGATNLLDFTAERITFNSSISPGRQYFVKLGISFDTLYNKLF